MILQIKHLTVNHKKDLRCLIEDFSFVLREHDRAVIIGEEGNGKSTLLKLIALPEELDYIEYTGEIVKNGVRMGYLEQEMSFSEKEETIWEFCRKKPRFYDMTYNELGAIAGKLGLPTDIFYSQQKLGELSGGEKVKLQMACILMDSPDLLLLDEPSNDIDIPMLEWLENFMLTCDFPILYVSHDETLIEKTANVIIHLEQINRKTKPRYTVARMDYKTYLDKRRKGLDNQERIARKEREEYQKQQERFRKIQQKVENQQNNISRQDPHGGRLLKKKMHAVKSLEHRFQREYTEMTEISETEDAIFIRFGKDTAVPNGKVILDFQEEQLSIGERILVKRAELYVQGPEKVCIIGRNGIGKTTFLKKIADELLKRTDIRAAYMPQDYEDKMDMGKTPVEFLQKSGDKKEIDRIRTYLGSMKYTADEMDHRIGELSGGQKAKLFFLKMSLEGSNVLILDEPTRNFSPLSNPVIRKLLREYQGAIISISHDRKYMEEVCDTVYELTEEGLRKRD